MRDERDNFPELEHEAVDTDPVLSNAIRKTEHFKISRRDTIANDLKNSTKEGLAAFLLSVAALLFLIAAVLVSYYQKGASRALIGLVPLVSLLLTAGSYLFAALGFRRKDKVRHYMEKRGLVISIVTDVLLVAVFIRGLMKLF